MEKVFKSFQSFDSRIHPFDLQKLSLSRKSSQNLDLIIVHFQFSKVFHESI